MGWWITFVFVLLMACGLPSRPGDDDHKRR